MLDQPGLPAPRLLQLGILSILWWTVLHAGLPVSRVRSVRGGGVGDGAHVGLLLCRPWEPEAPGLPRACAVVPHSQRRVRPERRVGRRLAAWLGPEAPQRWAGAAGQEPALLSVHGAVVALLFHAGVGWRILSVVAGLVHLLLHLDRVGWRWREGAQQRSPAGSREDLLHRAVRMPQGFLGSFALQGASSSVLKPHLDREDRKEELGSEVGQIRQHILLC